MTYLGSSMRAGMAGGSSRSVGRKPKQPHQGADGGCVFYWRIVDAEAFPWARGWRQFSLLESRLETGISVWWGWRLHPFYPASGIFPKVGMAEWTCLNQDHLPLCGDGGFHHCHCFPAYGALPRMRGWRDQGTDYTGSDTGSAWRGWRCVSFLRLRAASSILCARGWRFATR